MQEYEKLVDLENPEKNEYKYLVAIVAFDTAENGPSKVRQVTNEVNHNRGCLYILRQHTRPYTQPSSSRVLDVDLLGWEVRTDFISHGTICGLVHYSSNGLQSETYDRGEGVSLACFSSNFGGLVLGFMNKLR